MTGYDEERIAAFLRLLPPPPVGWVKAAQELPQARAEIAALVTRALENAAARARIMADLESALEAEGIEPTPSVVAALRASLEAD